MWMNEEGASQGPCRPGSFHHGGLPPLPVSLACLCSCPPNLSPARKPSRSGKGERRQRQFAKLVCSPQLESMATRARVSTWLSTEILLPGYVGDDEIASGSQTLFFEPLSRWGWQQNPEGPGRQSWS